MSHRTFHRIAGSIVVTGYAPNGGTLRFIAHKTRALACLHRSERLRLDVDRSVQLRLEGVGQRRAVETRDRLLRRLGFTRVEYARDGRRCVVSEPGRVEVVVLAARVDVRGRIRARVVQAIPRVFVHTVTMAVACVEE